jgi:hypothetical protein
MEAAMNNGNISCKTILMGVLVMIMAILGGGIVNADGVNLLDGKLYMTLVGPKGEEADGEDELVFKNGKLFSPSCSTYGFGDGVYKTRVEEGTIYFEAAITSIKHGKIVWIGKVDGDKIDGTYIWTKQRWYWKDAYEESWFKGTLQK